jgi:hypothetical protein
MQDLSGKNGVSLALNLAKGNLLIYNSLYSEYIHLLYPFKYGYFRSEEDTNELVK